MRSRIGGKHPLPFSQVVPRGEERGHQRDAEEDLQERQKARAEGIRGDADPGVLPAKP